MAARSVAGAGGDCLKELEREWQDERGLWKLRGFIDIARNVYALSDV
jgi:hypothetical protein